MHPPSSGSLWFTVPRGGRLEFAVGLNQDVWDKPGDGVDFSVDLTRLKKETIYSQYVDPRVNRSQRRWIDTSIDISRFAGERVLIVFRTLPHASADYDWAAWANPRVTSH